MGELPLGLSFDDVLIIPGYSEVLSRKHIDITTYFSRNIKLNMPLISANMDTVTESAMAIAMAREGGIGIIHRFLSTKDQAAEVQKVKRAENLVIADPITIHKEASLGDVVNLMRVHSVSGILVVNQDGVLEGIITARDVRFRSDWETPAAGVMTPQTRLITASPGITSEEAIAIFARYKIEKLPLIDEEGKLRGLITASDFMKTSKHVKAAKDKKGRLLVGAAIGVKDGLARAEKLIAADVDVLVIDVSHGHHKLTIDLLMGLKKRYKEVDVVAGNVATADGANALILAGADAVKVGIGPGAACSTRIVAGAGVPQVTAVMETALVAQRYEVPIIADGGIKESGDLAKAIAAGASSVMIGNLFAGTRESPGKYFIEKGVPVKIYRGLASRNASIDRNAWEENPEREDRTPEGINTHVPYKGEVQKVVQVLIDGLQSGMSSCGAKNIQEFWQKARFIRVTEAGLREGMPRP